MTAPTHGLHMELITGNKRAWYKDTFLEGPLSDDEEETPKRQHLLWSPASSVPTTATPKSLAPLTPPSESEAEIDELEDAQQELVEAQRALLEAKARVAAAAQKQ